MLVITGAFCSILQARFGEKSTFGGGGYRPKSGGNARYYMRVLLDITFTFSEKIDLILRGCDNYVQITHLIKKPDAFWQNNRPLENFRDQNHNWLLAKKIGKLAKKAENVLDIIGGFGGEGIFGPKNSKTCSIL